MEVAEEFKNDAWVSRFATAEGFVSVGCIRAREDRWERVMDLS